VNPPGGDDEPYIILLLGAGKADAGLPPTIVVPTVPIAIIGSAVSITIIRSVVMSAVAITIIRSAIAIPIPPVIIDFLHTTVALRKRQNVGLRGSGSGCVDHQDDDKRES
jgi:hypothetical protein